MLLPELAEEITPEFLNFALPNVTVDSCNVTRIGDGKGFTGQILRVEPRYAETSENAPSTLIAKLPIKDRDFRRKIWHVYEQEFQFYDEPVNEVCLRVPTCYFCARDVETHRGVLLLEDFGFARAGDQVAGCSIDDAQVAVLALASMHGRHWSGISVPVQEDEVSRRHTARRREMFPAWWTQFLGEYGDLVPETSIAIGNAITGRVDAVEQRLSSVPSTFVHGDFRLDNLFFMPDGSVGVVDWQKHGQGRAIWDVGRFVVSSLDPELPPEPTLDLLRSYHSLLMSNGVLDYSLDLLLGDFRASLLQMWLFVIRIAVLLDLPNERSRLLMRREIKQIGRALVKHDVSSLVPELKQ